MLEELCGYMLHRFTPWKLHLINTSPPIFHFIRRFTDVEGKYDDGAYASQQSLMNLMQQAAVAASQANSSGVIGSGMVGAGGGGGQQVYIIYTTVSENICQRP